ncbi:hypothetical protein TTSV1_gp29 [Thermoproteus tenax spherical virus 1]|uniref:Uncharacterized protein n=1 Tax=Thermoproteus tenax spherical virus 1 TaxID=292639 RepID=Q647D3_9VIRU|nr:hypothetical protein TTSV1_gp29 [Thermoproteus tenax spherical virus 1]AAU25979.1 hypothetical protein [Thermoproteus tenax spherical virus 1]
MTPPVGPDIDRVHVVPLHDALSVIQTALAGFVTLDVGYTEIPVGVEGAAPVVAVKLATMIIVMPTVNTKASINAGNHLNMGKNVRLDYIF